MRGLSARTLWIIFISAFLVLVLIAIAADWTTANYASSEYWVSHTQQVETTFLNLRDDLLSAEAGRLAYVASGDERELPIYEASVQQIPTDLELLRHLTADNPHQTQRLEQLRPLIEQRLGLLRESIELAKNKSGDRAEQEKLTESGAALTDQIRGILDAADAEEELLHRQRQTISDQTYSWTRAILAMAFVCAVSILAAAFWRLLIELRRRTETEQVVRHLNAELMQMQDEERRRIARELHDSLGQLLTSLKMNLDHIASHGNAVALQGQLLETCLDLTQQGIDETRTLSYLLHPPLLDEFGFASAAKWYIDGFSKRSKIEVKLDIPQDFDRMPDEVELALFRVLQESLTNIHRHSGSATAEIKVERSPKQVILRVTDHGKGISTERLEEFRRTRGGVGVGLAGMRERVEQFGGSFRIESREHSTNLTVILPLTAQSADRKKITFVVPDNPSGPTSATSNPPRGRAAQASS